MLITEKPTELRPENDLDNLPDDLLGPHPARVEMGGKILFVMDAPIEMGQLIKAEITIECYDDGRCKVGEDIVHYRKTKLLSAKPIGDPYTPEPKPAADPPPDDPAMIDEHGNIPEDDGQDVPDEYDPEFSHGEDA